MKNEKGCGRLGRVPVSTIADRAARFIHEFKTPRAVTLCPDGHVMVESLKDVIEDDLVGVWDQRLAIVDLWRHIADEIAHAASERGIAGGRGKRHEVIRRAA